MQMVHDAFFLIPQALLVLEKVTEHRLELVYLGLKPLKISLSFLVSKLEHVDTHDHLEASLGELSPAQCFLIKFLSHLVVFEHMVVKEPL